MPSNALLARWSEVLGQKQTAPAIYTPRGEVLRTFADIDSEAATWVDFREHEVIAIQIGNSPSWPAILLACFRAGAIPLPLGRHTETAERDLAMRMCGASTLIEGSALNLSSTPHQPPRPPDCDFLKLTSGTSSLPRAVRFTAAQLVADGDNICETMGLTDRDLNFGVIPFSHSYGFSNLLTPLLCRGIPLVASEDRMPRAILSDLASSGATIFPGMPVFYQTFAELDSVPELPALRLCISAGAPLSPKVAERFAEKFHRKIHPFYGASECGGIGYDPSMEPIGEEGCVGMPMRNVHLEHREDFTIEVRSDAVGLGYFPSDEPAVLSAGRFIPGDLIQEGPRGMRLVGRVSDVINVAGRKLNPGEVEAQLMRFGGVKQAVVFGVPSELRHEEPIACLAVSPDLNRAELLRFCHGTMSAWQVPKDLWIVDEIPVNERGKISRRELAAKYASRTRAPV